jgi:hypothetical protein
LKKCFLIFSAALLTASVVAATDMPKAEAFLGYNLVHFSPDTLPSFNLHGGDGQFAYNFKPWVSAVLDIGAVHAGSVFGIRDNVTSVRSGVDHTLVNFVLGPRFTFHRHSRWKPFAQVLLGGARATSSTSITLLPGGIIWPPVGLIVPPGTLQPIGATLRAERTGFAMLAGGGLDIKVSKHVALRPIGADYYLTRLPAFVTGNDTNKNHFRYSAGVNFLFGAR